MRNSYLELGVVILFLYGFISCSDKQEGAVNDGTEDSSQARGTAVKVHVGEIQKAPLIYKIATSGIIISKQEQLLSFPITGILEEIYVKNGDLVKFGRLMASIKNHEQELALKEAQLAYMDAYYKDEDERMFLNDSTFYKSRWKEVVEKTALKTGLLQSKVALERAKMELDQTRLYAPFTGVVSDLAVNAGSFISTNKPLCTLYDPDRLEIEVKLLEYDFSALSVGQAAEVRVLALKDRLYKGTVTEINPKIDESGHFKAKITLPSVEGLVPGMNTSVTIHLQADESHFLVPLAAVVHKSERDVIFTYEDGLAKWNYVTLGRQNGEQVEVLEGLSDGSEIILTNVFQLAHDSPVTIDTISQNHSAGL